MTASKIETSKYCSQVGNKCFRDEVSHDRNSGRGLVLSSCFREWLVRSHPLASHEASVGDEESRSHEGCPRECQSLVADLKRNNESNSHNLGTLAEVISGLS